MGKSAGDRRPSGRGNFLGRGIGPGGLEFALQLAALGFQASDIRAGGAFLIALLHRARLLPCALVVEDMPVRQPDFSRRQTALCIRARINLIVHACVAAKFVYNRRYLRRTALALPWKILFQWRAFLRENSPSTISRMVAMKWMCGLMSSSDASGQWIPTCTTMP